MNAFDAMVDVLTINETVEKLKNKNTGDYPDKMISDLIRLLVHYRDVLTEEMSATTLKVFNHED